MDANEARYWILVGHLTSADLIDSIREWREVARKHPRKEIRQHAGERIDRLMKEATRRNLTIPTEDLP